MTNLYFMRDRVLVEMKGIEVPSSLKAYQKPVYLEMIQPTDGELDQLSTLLNLHYLTRGEIASQQQLPRLEEFDKYLSTIFYDVVSSDAGLKINTVNVILTPDLVVTVAEAVSDTFTNILANLRNNLALAFSSSSAIYQTILDMLVDNLFQVLSNLQEELEDLQENLLEKRVQDSGSGIMQIRKQLLQLRKVFIYEQEVLYKLAHEKSNLLSSEQAIYMKEIFHHLLHLNASLQEYSDWAAHLSDAYTSTNAANANDKLDLLTLISYIFSPLGFLTGWYGMNFRQPECNLDYGYYYFIGAVITMSLGMLVYFKKKKLLG